MKTKAHILMLASAMTIAAGCSSTEEDKQTPDVVPSDKTEVLNVVAQPEYVSRIDLTDYERTESQGINEFSMNLFNVMAAEEQESFTLSPLGVALCLGLHANAIDDNSTQKIVEMFGAKSVDDYNKFCQKLLTYLPCENNGAEMMLANSAWISENYNFSQSYLNCLNEYYYADAYNTNFADAETAQSLIDAWCSLKTKGTIDSFPLELNASTIYVLINSMYFNSAWDSQFDKNKTTSAEFVGLNVKSNVSMMHQTLFAGYAKTDAYSVVRLPYSLGVYEMDIILPDLNVNVNDLSKSLSYDEFNSVIGSLETSEVNLSLPKFNIQRQANLTQSLIKLGFPYQSSLTKAGIDAAFSAKVLQKTFADVDEEGTRVAAVTTISMEVSPGVEPDYKKVDMNINRPFIFFVRNKVTGSILMAGRVCDL